MAHRRKLAAAVLATAAATVLAGCTGGTSSSSGGGSASGSTGGTQTVKYLIGQPDTPADLGKVKSNIADFEAKNENIKVKLTVLPNDQLRTVLQTQLRSGNGPDVFGYDTGPGFAGVLAKAGLLYDLTPAYEKYGWKTYDWAKERVTFGGKLLGIPDQVEELGIYYNKDIFAKQGIAEPNNLGDLEAAAEKIKAAGKIPMTFSDQEGWEGGHILSMALASNVGSAAMLDYINGKKSWSSPEVVQAIDTFFVQFNKKGYLPKTPTGIKYDPSNALFYSGKAAMNPTGSWLANDMKASAKFDVGFIPFPSADGKGIFAGGLGSGTFVSAKTKVPDAAVAFLNWGQSPEHGKWQVQTFQTIPPFPVDTSGVQADPLFKQILSSTSEISSGKGEFGYNIDVLTPDKFNQAMWSGLQAVLTGSKTSQEAADAMQAAYQASKSG